MIAGIGIIIITINTMSILIINNIFTTTVHNGDVDQGANGDEAPFLYSGGGEPRIWKNHSREEDRC